MTGYDKGDVSTRSRETAAARGLRVEKIHGVSGACAREMTKRRPGRKRYIERGSGTRKR